MANLEKGKEVKMNGKSKQPTKKVQYVVGFDKVALDMKNKVKKLASRKGISSLNLMGIRAGNGEPKWSGGIVGDSQVIVEGLYYMAKQREDVKALITIVADALKANELQGLSRIVDLDEAGVIGNGTMNALIAAGISDLKELKRMTREEVLEIKNIGQKALKEIEGLMRERSWDFLTK